MLGGMIGPIAPAAAIRAVAKSMSYPFLFIAGIMMEPTAAVSAVDDPETPAKIIEAITEIIPRLPLINPKQALEKSTILREIPPLSINSPASINNGIAMIGQESRAVNIRCGTNTMGKVLSARREKLEPIPRANAIGIPSKRRIKMDKNKMSTFLVLRRIMSSFSDKTGCFDDGFK